MIYRVLFERLLAAKGLDGVMALVYWSVGWGIEVLVERLLTAERPVALVALVYWSVGWGIDVLVEALPRFECPIAPLTFEVHPASPTILVGNLLQQIPSPRRTFLTSTHHVINVTAADKFIVLCRVRASCKPSVVIPSIAYTLS